MNQSLHLDQMVDLRDLFHTLFIYKWAIVSITLLATIMGILYAFSITPTYQATVTILIEAKGNEPVRQVQDVYDPGYGKSEYYATQTAILKSTDLVRRVVEKLDLLNHHAYAEPEAKAWQKMLNWRAWLPALTVDEAPLTDAQKRERRVEQVTKQVLASLTIEQVTGTQLVKASYESKDPELAALVANTLADLFIENSLEARLTVAQKANSWLTEKLASIQQDMQKAEQALQAFREQESLVNVGGQRGLVEDDLIDNAKRLREARRQRTELGSAYEKIREAGNDPEKLEKVSVLLQGDVVQSAKKSVLLASENVKQLETRYGAKHPEMIAVRARLDEAKAAYHTQLLTAANGMKAAYEIALANERALSQIEAGARGTIRGLDRKEYQLKALERDVETNSKLYDMFLSRFKETDLTGNFEVLSARIIDPATTPRRPFKPRKKRIAFFSMVGGLLMGLMLTGLLVLISDTVRNSEELESLTGLPLLGALPVVGGIGVEKVKPDYFLTSPKEGFSEGVSSIRTGVLLSDIGQKKKRILVTSSIPGEGKTTLATNLALAHGQTEKVLLVEGDLRRPSIAKGLGYQTKNLLGLPELLTGGATLENAIHHYAAGNIDILPVGKLPPNPIEIFTSAQFRQLMDSLATKYDRIIIDSAPCHAVSDTYLLARSVDAIIFLIKADSTTRNQIKTAVRKMKHAELPVLGTVINQVDMKKHAHDFGTYYYDYGYYS